MSDRPIVWTIAGSDSGGGAGVQADLLTLHDLGTHGASVVTAVTAQNSVGVTAVEAVSDTLFERQLDALAEDLPPSAIKIGLLGSADQVRSLVQRLPDWRRCWPDLAVVLDPVCVATSGDRLADDAVTRALRGLMPEVDLVTPNGPELAALTGHRVHDTASTCQAAEALVAATGTAVLAKGGHAPETSLCRDVLITPQAQWRFEQPLQTTPHRHGTGCTLSSAWAAARALGYHLEDAVTLASGYVRAGLEEAYATGAGAGTLARRGWPAGGVLPTVSHTGDRTPTAGFPALHRPVGVYPVVDDAALLADLVAAGASTVQLRVKSGAATDRAARIRQAIDAGRRHGAQVFINDHWRLAIEYGAYGVHLGQEDLAEADLDAIADGGLRLGLSTHGYAELARARRFRPSYIALGHVFPTRTKAMPSQPQGLTRLGRYRAALDFGPPTVAIGGIKAHHLSEVAACGVDGVAVVTAVTEAPDPVAAWRALDERWREAAQVEPLEQYRM